MRRATVGLAAAVLVLVGCAPQAGTVTNRQHSTPCYAKPVLHCEETWEVEVTDPTQRHPVYTDRPLSGWERVDRAVYERCGVGQRWPDCKGPR